MNATLDKLPPLSSDPGYIQASAALAEARQARRAIEERIAFRRKRLASEIASSLRLPEEIEMDRAALRREETEDLPAALQREAEARAALDAVVEEFDRRREKIRQALRERELKLYDELVKLLDEWREVDDADKRDFGRGVTAFSPPSFGPRGRLRQEVELRLQQLQPKTEPRKEPDPDVVVIRVKKGLQTVSTRDWSPRDRYVISQLGLDLSLYNPGEVLGLVPKTDEQRRALDVLARHGVIEMVR
jgi:hypothetical protein